MKTFDAQGGGSKKESVACFSGNLFLRDSERTQIWPFLGAYVSAWCTKTDVSHDLTLFARGRSTPTHTAGAIGSTGGGFLLGRTAFPRPRKPQDNTTEKPQAKKNPTIFSKRSLKKKLRDFFRSFPEFFPKIAPKKLRENSEKTQRKLRDFFKNFPKIARKNLEKNSEIFATKSGTTPETLQNHGNRKISAKISEFFLEKSLSFFLKNL